MRNLYTFMMDGLVGGWASGCEELLHFHARLVAGPSGGCVELLCFLGGWVRNIGSIQSISFRNLKQLISFRVLSFKK